MTGDNELGAQHQDNEQVRIVKRKRNAESSVEEQDASKRVQVEQHHHAEPESPTQEPGLHRGSKGKSLPDSALDDNKSDTKPNVLSGERNAEALLDSSPLAAVVMEHDQDVPSPPRPDLPGDVLPTSNLDAALGSTDKVTIETAVTVGGGDGNGNGGADGGSGPIEPDHGATDAAGTQQSSTQSRVYIEALQALKESIELPSTLESNPLWDAFPNYLGEGVRARLLSLGTLHLAPNAPISSAIQAAVKQLPSNSNKVLLGAPTNCDLYQLRVVRALSRKLGVRLMVVNAATLHLEDVSQDDAPAASDEGDPSGPLGGGPLKPLFLYDSPSEDDFDERSGPGVMNDDKDEDIAGRGGSYKLRIKKTARRHEPGSKPSFPTSRGRPGGKESLSAATIAAAKKQRETQKGAATDEEGKEKAADGDASQKDTNIVIHIVPETAAAGADDVLEQEHEEEASASDKPVEKNAETDAPEMSAAIDLSTATGNAQQQQFQTTLNLLQTLKASATAAAAAAAALAVANATTAPCSEQEEKVDLDNLPELSDPDKPVYYHGALPSVKEEDGKPSAATATVVVPNSLHQKGAAKTLGGSGAKTHEKGGASGEQQQDAPTGAGTLAASEFKVGDRVTYVGKVHPRVKGNLDTLQQAISRVESRQNHSRLKDILPTLIARRSAAMQAMTTSRSSRVQPDKSPALGSKGNIVSIDVITGSLEIVFDEAFDGGITKPGHKPRACFSCPALEVQKADEKDDAWVAAFDALFAAIKEECTNKEPLIVFVQNMDRLVKMDASDHIKKLEEHLAALPERCLLFAAFCTRALTREQKQGMGGMSILFGGRGGGGSSGGDAFAGMGGGGGDDDSSQPWFDPFSRRSANSKHRKSSKGKLLTKLFPNTLDLHPPNQDGLTKAWRQMVEADVAAMRETANRAALKKALVKCGLDCADLEAVSIKETTLARQDVEQVICGALTELLVENQQTGAGDAEIENPSDDVTLATADGLSVPELKTKKDTDAGAEAVVSLEATNKAVTLKASHIMAAADIVKKMLEEAAPAVERHALKDIQADQYEKQLLNEVIPPEEIAVSFDDIGALDAVKDTLHEVVILPLQRPELFTRGALTKPTKGLLLFGPPGTGKTMLAKAVASESGAHFINVNMSAITSKWFGEGERLVRALFSLAHKLSPSVIFVDELDSFLSKRSNSGSEHEALRKMKNEFMQHWDGLRTKQHDRVLVLGATNRPMDLDDAVIRRMPRRIFVPLPDAANRERILKVILKDEALDEELVLDFGELARMTDGYSGSDLKNLCIAAAYFPVRELLAAEKGSRQRQKNEGKKEESQSIEIEQPSSAPAGPSSLRAISLKDFEAAMQQVTSSTHKESATMSELKQWNDQFGEGGSRKVETLQYYT